MPELIIKPTGDCAVSVTFPGEICVQTNLKVRALQLALEQLQLRGRSGICAH